HPASLILPARPTRLRDPRLRLGLAVDGLVTGQEEGTGGAVRQVRPRADSMGPAGRSASASGPTGWEGPARATAAAVSAGRAEARAAAGRPTPGAARNGRR